MNVQEATPLTERREGARRSPAEAASTDERWLVGQAKSGSASSFGELDERHRLRIYHTAFRILRNREDAEDAVQLLFQRAFTKLGRFREDSTFSTWVTRIAINQALMLLRQRRPNVPVPECDNHDTKAPFVVDLTDKGPTPEQALVETERRAAVLQATSHLQESLRTVVLLRELQGLTSAETARRLGLTVSAVKARAFHARCHLPTALGTEIQGCASGFLSGTRNRKLRSAWFSARGTDHWANLGASGSKETIDGK